MNMRRYSDLYAIARGFVSYGEFLKFCAIGMPILLVVAAAILTMKNHSMVVGAIVVAAIVGIGIGIAIYSYAISVCANGQLLMAMADIAVNTSPLLNKRQKAEIIELSEEEEELSGEEEEEKAPEESDKDDDSSNEEEGLSEKEAEFCYHCGEEITTQTGRCPKCGKKL